MFRPFICLSIVSYVATQRLLCSSSCSHRKALHTVLAHLIQSEEAVASVAEQIRQIKGASGPTFGIIKLLYWDTGT